MIKVPKKPYDCQRAAGYIAYMMGASCFHSCTCKSFSQEQSFLLHYREMPEPKALRIEDQVLDELAQLGTGFLRRLSDLSCEVQFSVENGILVVQFDTGGFESLSAEVNTNGSVRVVAHNTSLI
ncbi:MAG: hypothetical protein LUE86_07780 [Clostridiales bacterium]|nr:hypothetical protein [Clostridiales bacterium]